MVRDEEATSSKRQVGSEHREREIKSSSSLVTLRARCILFDLDGTLYESSEYSRRLEEEIVKTVAAQLNADETDTKSILAEKRKKIGTLTRTIESLGIERKLFYKTLANRIDPGLYLSPDEETCKVIKELRTLGFRIGLVSNSGRELVAKILDAIQLEPEWFDSIVTSNEAEPKPSLEPYTLAMKHLGCSEEWTVYVGDREEAELRPAKRLGLKTILLSKRHDAGRWADAVVTSIPEILEVITLDTSITD